MRSATVLALVLVGLTPWRTQAFFTPAAAPSASQLCHCSCHDSRTLVSAKRRPRSPAALVLAATPATGAWNGDVVPDGDGRIRGCAITQLASAPTEWSIAIDGVEADLGRFSEAIYQKFVRDAKQQRFQGFRPGTIPPQLEPTYRTYAMDECARETVLEAMKQNNIRPFENCRLEMFIYDLCIPPAPASKKTKSKKRKPATTDEDVEREEPAAAWRTFETMKGAIDAGWRPGQSFSFRARDIKGQKVKQESESAGATSLGVDF